LCLTRVISTPTNQDTILVYSTGVISASANHEYTFIKQVICQY
jgi:hypothetical protein